jgi:hypothetical protein
MALGPGKYDDLATCARERAEAEGVVLVILGGKAGAGFSVQANAIVTLALPGLLRRLADDIERDMKGLT